ncbi:MAG: N-acetylmuramoyl-L-alanine amidase, partial [Bacteroidetes bacterium]|nr:N-acetylmuramoyl-L-alanine amidase [Bacteroidota bacterium]
MKKIIFTTLLYFIVQFSFAQVVVIDAGHGYCSDCTQNCTSNVRSDHEILTAMAVSLKLDSLFSNYCTSVTTYLTRESNDCGDFPSLSQRATMANNWGADRFLSVHCNAGGGTGTETFWCNNSISSNAECQTFAQEVQDQMVSYGSWNSRRCVEDYTYLNFHLGVLHPTNAVGCLNEIGFVDYTSDLNKLLSNSWRNQFALAYYEALQSDLGLTCSPQVLDCSSAVALSCGVSYSGSASSASSNVGTYGCNNWTETGPERVHTITPTTSGTITATISNFTGDLDVYILGSCDASDCLGTVSSSSATYNNAVAGHTYYVVVDADDGSGSAYNLIVNCANEQHDFTLNNAQITSNTNVIAGENIQVSVSQNYSGNTINNSYSVVQYYLSTDCTLDANDILLGSDSSILDINNTSELETATLNIPQNTSTGNYNIIFVADAMNAFAEQNESNNMACISFQVVPPPTLDCSGAVTLTCGVSYHGNTSSAPNVISTYGCNNWTETGPERVHTIIPNFTGTLTATISNFTGDLDVYILGSCDASDCLGTVSSSSATFNGAIAGQTYYVVVDADDGSGSAYDLVVDCPTPSEDITLSGATVSNNMVDSNTNITVGVNQVYAGGQNSSALNDVAVSFYLSNDCSYDASDVLLGTEISDLGNNNPSIYEAVNFSINPSTVPGTYQILIIADSNNDITESNETNNTLCLPITVIYPNDVTLSNPSLNINTVVAGNDVIASVNHNYSGSQSSAN